MALNPGTRLGPYEIVSPLGAGGMGEVYRARDTRLGRDVAVKVLPQHLSENSEVRARFEREAKTVSSLNHPNICTLFDVGREGETDYLVMELIEGETLATRITKGSLSLADTLRIGSQIADALDRAHRAGVVHRDLKPGNIMLTKSGAKLMDFGLARATGMVGGGSGSSATVAALTQSPTMAQPLTAEGTIVGTFQYMSPEQLEGKETDARSDIWALGCVLYEMPTGKRAFEGATQASLISAIMRDQPRAMTELSPMSPPALDRVVSQCLAKDPDERFQSAHDVRLALDMMNTVATATVPSRSKRSTASWLWLAGGIVIGAALGFGASRWLAPAPRITPARVSTLVNSGADQQPIASPDGKTVAFASARTGRSRIWIKQLASSDEVALTDGEDSAPQFSPDGSQVLYVHSDPDGSSLWRVSIVGGQPRRLVENAVEGAWSPDGKQLAFLRLSDNLRQGEVWLADADGSGARRLHAEESSLRWISWSPRGDRVMAVSVPLANAPIYYVMVPTNGDSVQTVMPVAGLSLTSNPVWLGSGDRIAYAIVEARATSATGQASRIVEQSLRTGKVRELLSLPSSVLNLAVLGSGQLLMGITQSSQNLVLVDHPGAADSRERWLTRGASIDRQPTFSPDGKHVLFSSNRSGNLDVWEMDVETGALSRITDHPGNDWDPAYTPDGRSILWSSDRSGVFEIWEAAADGTGARQVSKDGVDAENPGMTPDGQWILFLSGRPELAGACKMHVDGSQVTLLVAGVNLPEMSPDGALFSAPSGIGQRTGRDLGVFRMSDAGAIAHITLRVSVTVPLGRSRWAGERRLAYIDRDGDGSFGVWLRDITEKGAGEPRKLAGFDSLSPTESFGVTKDGSRVVLSVRNSVSSIAVAENVPGIDMNPRAGGRTP
jgi:serine/threonine protein kinase